MIIKCSNMRKLIYLIWAIVLFTSCQKSSEGDSSDSIYLSAAVESSKNTKSPYIYTSPTQDAVLHAAIWASSIDRQYKIWGIMVNREMVA